MWEQPHEHPLEPTLDLAWSHDQLCIDRAGVDRI